MESVGGVPVECLSSPELSRIWSGWSTMKDKEVVREASAKGTHIDLAHKFLSYRKQWSIDQARNYFDVEVDIWVNELLKKHQVHRASHVLNNIDRNPLEYMRQVCLTSSDPELRDYLVSHVSYNKGFSDDDIEACEILNCLKNYKAQLNFDKPTLNCWPHHATIDNVSIEEIKNLELSVKDSLITELYFHTFEASLSNKLKTDVVWDYLLMNNKVDLLICWIDVQFNRNKSMNNVDSNFLQVFETLKITQEMIENIEPSESVVPVKEYLFNHLAKYGIFTEKEGQDVKLTLSRFFSALIPPSEIENILTMPCCNLDTINLLKKIFSISYFHTLLENYDDELYFQDNKLLKSLHFLNKSENMNHQKFDDIVAETIPRIFDDPEEYFRNNPLIMLYLIVSNYKNNRYIGDKKSLDFKEFICNNQHELVKGFIVKPDFVHSLFKNIPYLRDVIDGASQNETITMYQLLQGFKDLDVQELFKWRKKNDGMPHFGRENLIRKYGHKEELTYKYYLKEARPSMAAYILLNRHSKNFNAKIKSRVAFHTHLLGLKHINDPEIISTCIAFMEFIGVNSEYLRFHVTAADYVKNELNISINDLLESVAYQNLKDLASIIYHLESAFKNECQEVSMNNVNQFIEVLKSWNFIGNFAKLHNSRLPSTFLKYLAKNNLWFEFVLVGHIFSYPLEQITENVMEFEDENIREHLLISLCYSGTIADSHVDNEQKQKNQLSEIKPSNSPKKHFKSNENGSNSKSESSNNLQYFPLNQKNSVYTRDLWITILKCHQSLDPPGAFLKASRKLKSPILTIFATCYEPSATPSYCYSWLIISTNNQQLIESYTDCLNEQIWSARSVADLFRQIIAFGFIDTLSRGFQIFMPDNSLCYFFNFLVQYIKHSDFETCIKDLGNFLNSLSTLKSNKMIDWDDAEMTYLNNECWVAIVAIECILTALGKCLKSIELQTKLLAILVENNFNSLLHFNELNFEMLWKIVTSLGDTDVKIDFTSLKLTENSSNITQEVHKCIEKLINSGNFIIALELSKISGLPCSKVILNQYRNEFKQRNNSELNEKFDIDFWQKCATDIKKCNVSFELAAEFFVEHAEKVKSHKERYEILRLAHATLKPISTDQQTLDTLEMAMWKSCVLAGPDSIKINVETRPFNKLKTQLLSTLSNLQVSCVLNDKIEEKAVETLINKFIDAEDLETALRISAIFNYKHHDLKILLICLSLAEGEIIPDAVDLACLHNSEAKLVSSGPSEAQTMTNIHRRFPGYHFNKYVNDLDAYSLSDDLEVESLENDDKKADDFLESVQRLLFKLINFSLNYRSNVANKILLLHKLSKVFKRNYNSLLMTKDPIEILLALTTVRFEVFDERIELMSDVIDIYRLEETEVSKFFAGELILHITKHIDGNYQTEFIWGDYWPSLLFVSFGVDFRNDPSLGVAWEIIKSVDLRLDHFRRIPNDITTLKIAIELLIQAHDLFSSRCNVPGIACVLKKCQNLVNNLQNLKLWNLLARLVTGIGRFTEMNYIFKILKENHQFELLLTKRSVNKSTLRTALLDFCQKQYPDDKETFQLVVEHFLHFTENAMRWENEAKIIIREMIKETRRENVRLMNNFQGPIRFTRNSRTEEKLRMAMSNFTHATEYYLKDDKLNMANRCSHQAQLIALQLSLLHGVSQNQEVMCLLNLSNEEVNKVVLEVLSLPQILIIVEAYSHNADWPSVIYRHVIINGETKFFKDFLVYKRLTPAILQDCVCKYRAERNITKQMTLNMQNLISELNDVECKYVLASQLGFKNIVETMLSDPTIGSYLKDTVWKQGYNPQEFIGENFRS